MVVSFHFSSMFLSIAWCIGAEKPLYIFLKQSVFILFFISPSFPAGKPQEKQ